MRVQEVITANQRRRYLLLDQQGDIVVPVVRFLKYKDSTGAARNTLRSYAFRLKLYFDFLDQKRIDPRTLDIAPAF